MPARERCIHYSVVSCSFSGADRVDYLTSHAWSSSTTASAGLPLSRDVCAIAYDSETHDVLVTNHVCPLRWLYNLAAMTVMLYTVTVARGMPLYGDSVLVTIETTLSTGQ